MELEKRISIMSAYQNVALDILGQEVELSKVDKTLKEFWADDSVRCRASLLNFAIYSESPDCIEKNTQLLQQITKQHACRGLLVVAAPEGDEGKKVRSYITVHCQVGEGKRSVCSEQLSLLLEGGNSNRISNLIFAHLESDLPLHFWWQGDLSQNFNETLYREIDRLFVDSSTWSDPVAGFAKLHEAVAHNSGQFRVYDLSWLRSHQFRTALATCFADHASLSRLNEIDRLELVHSKGALLSALLLTAWLTVRLKGEISIEGNTVSIVRSGAKTIRVELKEGDGPEPLQKLTLFTCDHSFEVSRHEGSSYVHSVVRVGDLQREELLPADYPTDSELIIDQLSRLGGQSLYSTISPLMEQLLKVYA